MKREHFDAVIQYFVERDRLTTAVSRHRIFSRIGRESALRFLEWLALQKFLRRYPVDPRRNPEHICDLLKSALKNQDAKEAEAADLLGWEFGFPRSCLVSLNTLLTEDWHEVHEDFAVALGDLRDPSSIDPLYRAALMDLDYLAYDQACALAAKCCCALGAINTEEAIERLRALTQSENPVKAAAAKKQLRHQQLPPDRMA
ncbi:hypothetical protein [Pelagibius marinus]|uniref:hypothetical protein n=1 Tax=Pelagibius marinus TaxID=2762760 RepID=UPI0018726448|nr:hypothetical protein [Pelagibius marinus]